MVYSVVFGFIGWRFIPHLVTKHGLTGFHTAYSNFFGLPPPKPGTPAYAKHYRYLYAVVVLGYLFYNLVEGSSNLPANFYEVLGVYPDADESDLKYAFRQFAKRAHPDRVGPQGEALFIKVKDVYDSLKNPNLRFAYDRFGPDVLEWRGLSTPQEYLRHGLLQASGYQLTTGLALLIVSSIGSKSPIAYWRYMLYLSFLVFELALLVYPSPSSMTSMYASGNPLHALFPQRVAFQQIIFLHQLFIFLSMALTQVAPVLFPRDQLNEQDALLQQLNALAGVADREASVLLHTELHSIHPTVPELRVPSARIHPYIEPSSDVLDQLTDEMERMIIERQLMMQDVGPLKSAWEGAIGKGRKRAIEAATNFLRPKMDDGFNMLPSPISPNGSPPGAELNRSPKADGVVDGATRLPSPRPSPPPPILRKRSSFVRARSVSY